MKNGKTVLANVTLEVVEALTMAEMVGYNLVTMNDNKSLASGGMIYIQPKSKGKNVNINPNRPLYIEIPTEEYDPEMMAWESEIDEKGDINWKNPKPLEKFLTKIDFANLDFLPEGFSQAVSAGLPYKSHTKTSDELVDSLYYNFGLIFIEEISQGGLNRAPINDIVRDVKRKQKRYFGINSIHGKVVDEQGRPIPNTTIDLVNMGQSLRKTKLTNKKGKFKFRMVNPGTGMVLADKKEGNGISNLKYKPNSISKPSYYSIGMHPEEVIVLKRIKDNSDLKTFDSDQAVSFLNTFKKEMNSDCYINPQSIQTICSEAFENTFLATKEFEQRLQILHQMPNAQNLFDKYVNNLNENLWEVDQMVADRLDGDNKKCFEDFACQKLTNVKNDGIYQKQLTEYYNREKKKHIEEVKERQAKYASKATEELIAEQGKLQSLITEYNSLTESNPIANSTFANRNIVMQDISIVQSTTISRPNVINSRNSYSTSWYSSGWMNIDKYLKALGTNPKEVQIILSKKKNENGRVKIYQCLNSLKAVIPLVIVNQLARAKFPKKNTREGRLMRSTYCVGLRTNQGKTELAYQKYNPYNTDNLELTWEEVEPKNLIKKLRALPGFNTYIIKDLKAEKKAIDDQLTQVEMSREIKLKRKTLSKEMEKKKEVISDLEKEIAEENIFMKALHNVVNKCRENEPEKFTALQLY